MKYATYCAVLTGFGFLLGITAAFEPNGMLVIIPALGFGCVAGAAWGDDK